MINWILLLFAAVIGSMCFAILAKDIVGRIGYAAFKFSARKRLRQMEQSHRSGIYRAI